MSETERVLETLKRQCFEKFKNYSKQGKDGMCNAVFDGILCWPDTRAGQIAALPCPDDLVRSTLQGNASKECTKEGIWFSPENSTKPFTNYTMCGKLYLQTISTEVVEVVSGEWIPILKTISYVGYAVSIVSLVTSIFIITNIKRLHCARNKLHTNLFLSFLFRLFMSILKDSLFVGGTTLFFDTVYDENGEPVFEDDYQYSWVCKALISIRWYFIIANFTMMLMEGVYLHNLMFLNILSDNTNVKIYCLLGWGLPMIFIIPWIVAKVLFEDQLCWTQNKIIYITLLIDGPIGITVMINFVLFMIIVRVLTVKLNNVGVRQRRIKYRKFLKATLILILLFGVPYSFSLLMSFYIRGCPVLEIIWLFFDQTFTAFQGLFAALVYCLLNSEVQIEVRRKYLLMKDRKDKEFRRSRTISNTQQFSLQANDEEGNKGNDDFVPTVKFSNFDVN